MEHLYLRVSDGESWRRVRKRGRGKPRTREDEREAVKEGRDGRAWRGLTLPVCIILLERKHVIFML